MVWRVDHRIPSQASEIKTNKVVLPIVRPSSLEIKLVTSYPGTEASANTSDIIARTIGVMSTYPGAPVDYDKLMEFTWHTDGDGMIAGSGGVFAPNLSENTSDMLMATSGIFIIAELLASNTSNMTAGSYVDIYVDANKANWIQWSDIGSLVFTISRKNVAGEMPMDWSGNVDNIHKLGSRFIVYGDNGVSFISPTGKLMGLSTIHTIGLLGRDAFAGNDFVHFFIDKLYRLHQLGEVLEKLDYSEYLSNLTDPVLTLDHSTNLLYMCDGTTGYVYSVEDKSLGKCAPNITGISYKSGSLHVAAPAAITIPSFEVWTNIEDLGTRKGKNIFSMEIGVDLAGTLHAAIRMREDKVGAFTQTGWHTVDSRGQVFIPCYGYEFQFGMKADVYEYFEVDYLKITAEVNAY